jgi:large subunit ribosomal protein L9
MKIVLLKEVPGLGHIGEIKEVRGGYARNFLIPRGWADILTKHSLGMLDAQKKKRERLQKEAEHRKELVAKKIDDKNFNIWAKADNKGTLYSKIDAKDIAEELQKQGYTVEVGDIILNETIKKVGEYGVTLKLVDKDAKININISDKDDQKEKD